MTNEEIRKAIAAGVCPACGGTLSHKEGCLECLECGWSICEEA